ncbi:MAG: hypothetical protein HYY63_02445, partial [Elusimicrobia bacterium]|nr:hypothetical protein [Elusimicrobiota bacterium]
ATSATFTLEANTNPDGTVVVVSTGTGRHYSVANSSAGIFSGGSVTLVITGLTPNSGYGFQTGARDSTVGAATQSVTVVAATTTLAAAPTLYSFSVFATSVSIALGTNGNPAGTALMISTGINGDFGVSNSSVGIYESGVTTFVITGLIPRTGYELQAAARDSTAGAATNTLIISASTTTLAAPPTIVSFRIFTTSVTVTLGRNGNPTGTDVMISTGTDRNYGGANFSAGLFGAGNKTLTITGLSTATVYGFQAGTKDAFPGATTQTTIISASTSTLAVAPLVSSFQVFATSVVVNINPNTNPTGTRISVSSNSFGIASSTVGIVSGGGQLTTMTISGLIPNTAYDLNVGAFDSTGGASTQSAAGNEISTTTLAAPPTITSFRVFTTSITVTLGANGNSSKGIAGSGDVTLVISNLSTATVYGFQAGTNDSTGSAATRTTIITASTSTFAVAPLVSSFRVFTTSVVVNINPNSNPAGTGLSISSNAFGIASSTVGIVSGGGQLTTMTISGLIPNTAYNLNLGAFDSTGGASTQSAAGNEISTTTLAAAPSITSFRIFTTSISVTVGGNGNLAGVTLTISTGTGGHYAVSNSSKGIVDTGDVTLVISNLSTATVYGFQAGTNDSTDGASTQTTVITASTSTFAVAPLVSSFQVFATSVVVNINPNTNPAGTGLSISSNAFGVASSTVGVVSGAGQLTTMTISGLIPNTAYNLNLGAFDSTGGASTQSAAGNEISTTTLAAAPSITSFRVFTTSVSITLGAKGNPSGTTLTISTGTGGHYAIANSSKGIVGSGDVTLAISNLSTATVYGLQAGTNDSTDGASTQTTIITASTATLGAAPTITSFRIFTTSISVTIGANGNPVGTTLTISTGTGGHYAVSNSSKGITGSADVTLVISNLSTATVCGFQAGTNDSTGSAATQTTVITASTSTIAAPPTITSFRVFTTSISVTLGSNGNPVGTTLAISTGTGGLYAVSNSSKGIVGSSDVTLVISNLSTATVYGFQAGANDTTGSAATLTASISASTSTLAVAPLLSSFQVFATSVVVNINPNTNPTGTKISISSNAFGVASSTVGIVSGGGQLTTMTISGLIPNTAYNLDLGAFDSTGGASTQSSAGNEISTTTLAAPPTITSFRVFTTSLTVTLGANGNPSGTTLTLSTGTGGHYVVTNSTKGIVGSADVTLVISNLSTATVHGFQVGTNDSTGSASTQTTIITASTSTLAVVPIVTSFQVFSTSITVTLGSNSNPVGTAIFISTGLDRNFTVANASAGIVAGQNTSLSIIGIAPNTGFEFQAGARDGTAGASTIGVTVTESTTTLVNPPTIVSYRIFTTSASITLARNGNPTGTAALISTGTNGDFGSANSVNGVFPAGNLTLTIANLSSATGYAFQAGARDFSDNAVTVSVTVIGSTSTLAAPPLVTGFQVFATSITVSINPNG